MIKNIIEYELKENEKINFEDIDKLDIDAFILMLNQPDWLFDLSSEIKLENTKKIWMKYWLCREWIDNFWEPKIRELIGTFDEKNFLKFIKHTKKIFILVFWDYFWYRAYKNFLHYNIITDNYFYDSFIKDKKKIKDFFLKEFKKLIKYYPDREYKVWFIIDELNWFSSSRNREDLDNWWEIDRYNYWRKYKEKWEVKLIS